MPQQMIRLICPNLKCRKVLSVPSHARGKNVRCRNCGMRVEVPPASATPRPAADAEASTPATPATPDL